MKLKFSTKVLLLAILLTLIAIAFIAFAFSHPELSLPISLKTTLIKHLQTLILKYISKDVFINLIYQKMICYYMLLNQNMV